MKSLDEQKLNRALEYIKDFQRKEGRSPSFRQVQKACGFSYISVAQRYVNALISRGLIKKNDLGGIKIAPRFNPNKTIIAPMIGSVACGSPILAEENIEGSYKLPSDIFGNSETFLLRAKGDSMINAGIKDKDILVVKKCSDADDGQIVIALIDNEATAKRLFRKKGKVILHPENPEFEDIIVEDNLSILGVVISCIHNF